jgi:hypothetical protein
MLAIYQRLLQLYPRNHRRNFADEMSAVFEDLQGELATQGFVARLTFYVREGSGLLVGALREHWRESAVGRFSMQSEFRFPKATWILMTIILAGVVTAIEKGEAISASVTDPGPVIPPIHSGPHTLVFGIAELFAAMYAIGLLAWGILFMLRRSGAERA